MFTFHIYSFPICKGVFILTNNWESYRQRRNISSHEIVWLYIKM